MDALLVGAGRKDGQFGVKVFAREIEGKPTAEALNQLAETLSRTIKEAAMLDWGDSRLDSVSIIRMHSSDDPFADFITIKFRATSPA